MSVLYVLVTAWVIFELIQKWYLISTQRKEYKLFVTPAFLWCIISVVVTYFIVFSKNVTYATFFYGLNFICLDAIVYGTFLFVRTYAASTKKIIPFRVISIICITIDTICLLLNNYKNFYFTLTREPINYLFKEHWGLTIHPLMYFHYTVCFIIFAETCWILIKKTKEVPSIYKRKYIGFFVVYFLGIVLSYSCNFLNLAQDYVVFCYGILGNFAFQYSLVVADEVIKLKATENIVQTYSLGVCWFNIENRKIFSNTKADEYFELLHMNDYDVEKYLHHFLKKNHARNLDIVVNDEKFVVDDKTYYFEITYRRIYSNKDYIGCYIHLKDITETKTKHLQEEYISNIDELTGIYNKKHFMELAEQRIRDYPGVTWLMICSNIKDFKIINNIFGREVGDNILKAQAEVIRTNAHEGTVFGRIVDDKFAILMNKKYYKEEEFKERIIDVARISKNQYYHMNQQIGIYESIDVRESVQFMYDKALMAVEKSFTGNNQIAYYDDSIMKQFLHERNIISDFDFALNSSQFIIYLQPIFNEAENLIGAEVLVRWNKSDVGMLQPEEFLPLFEKTEIIYKLDMFIWEKAIQQFGRWNNIGKEDLFLSVNVSTYDFNYIDIADIFRDLKEHYDFDSSKLKISFSEDAFILHHDKMIETVKKLHEMGFEIEVTGLGNYCFSLNTVKDAEIDYFRVDMKILKSLTDNHLYYDVLRTIMEFSNDLNVKIIGKSIEDKKQMEFMKDFGCKILQGFYLGQPLSRYKFEEKYL